MAPKLEVWKMMFLFNWQFLYCKLIKVRVNFQRCETIIKVTSTNVGRLQQLCLFQALQHKMFSCS